MANQTIKCMFCPCTFFTEKDHKRHMEHFSYYPDAHRRNWAIEMQRRQKYE